MAMETFKILNNLAPPAYLILLKSKKILTDSDM